MKITNELYLETRIYEENYREAWVKNEKTEKELRVASLYNERGKWFVSDLFQTLEQPSREDAITKFNYIAQILADGLRFLLNK